MEYSLLSLKANSECYMTTSSGKYKPVKKRKSLLTNAFKETKNTFKEGKVKSEKKVYSWVKEDFRTAF